jgi:hypothetical protein
VKYGDRHTKTGDGQGASYTLLPVKDAKAGEGVQPESQEGSDPNQENHPSQTTPTPSPYKETGVVRGGFDWPQGTPKHPDGGSWGGSRETRTGENPVAESSVLDEALPQLNAETTKH